MIRTLREALELSPENDKLRAHLAQTLLSARLYADAAEQFKQVAQRDPADRRSRLGLARAFYALEQWSAAIVVLEELQGQGAPEHEVLLYLSRALLKEDTLVFVEVKTRRNEDFGRAASAVNRGKRTALSRAAYHYLRKLKEKPRYFRFDVVEVIGQEDQGPPEIRHIEHAFTLEGKYRLSW